MTPSVSNSNHPAGGYRQSLNLVSFKRDAGLFGALVPSGTRDPVFFENCARIKAAVIKVIEDEFPDALAPKAAHATKKQTTSFAVRVQRAIATRHGAGVPPSQQ